MKIGYCRVSTIGQIRGNSLEEQERALKNQGAEKIYSESFTGTKIHRPVFDTLIQQLKQGDTLMVTKLDRFARTAPEACALIRELVARGITVHILNMGIADNSPMGKLLLTILAGFAEFERDMIVERTQAGKEIAKTKPGFKEGRPCVYDDVQRDEAIALCSQYTLKEVSEVTGMSVSTIAREKRKRKSIA